MSIAEVRHLPKVSGILLVTDKEFFSDIDPLPFSSSSQLLYSCMEEVVKKQLDTFESIWNEAVSGEKKIAELEKGTVSKGTEELTDENEIKFRMRERIPQMEDEKAQIETRIIETRTQFHNFIISSLKDTIERDWYFQEEILRRIYENYFELFKENIKKTLLLKNMNQNSKSK